MNNSDILELLKGVIHPESDRDIVTLGMVDGLKVDSGEISFRLKLTKPHDPMAGAIKRMAESVIGQQTGITPTIIIVEGDKRSPSTSSSRTNAANTSTGGIRHVVAVASGKGGVGKSTVTANLAVALERQGYSVGIIDADIYGPSMPKMFGVEGFTPMAASDSDEPGAERILAAESHGIKIQSIGFFVDQSDALIWRGPMATNALKQLIHQTFWGPLDFLLIDLPPGTGDLHLTIVGELKIDGAIIVSTPALVAIADVVRGISMFTNEKVDIPILGVVNNMAYFTPEELPDNKYYIFGQGDLERVCAEHGLPILAEIPLVQSIAHAGSHGEPIAAQDSVSSVIFEHLADSVVELLDVDSTR